MSLSVQFFSLLAMIGTGIVAAAFIDMIQAGILYAGKRSLIGKYGIVLEVFGWIIAGIWTFTILYTVRDGAWRIYDPFAQLSGLLLYMSFFHRPFRLIGRVILLTLLKPIIFVFHLLFLFVKNVAKGVFILLRILSTPFVLIFRKLFLKHFKNKEK